MTVNMRIQLIELVCRDTEDILDGDEFYLAGIALADPDVRQPILTTPIKTAGGSTYSLNDVIFMGPVRDDASVALFLKAFDEDVAKDWAQKPAWVDGMFGAAGGALGVGAVAALLTNPIGWATIGACAIGALTLGGFYFAMGLDKDDELGNLNLLIPASGPVDEVREWTFRQDGWWSGWDYTLRLTVHRDLPKDVKDGKDSKDNTDNKQQKDSKDSKDTKDNKDGKDGKEGKEYKEKEREKLRKDMEEPLYPQDQPDWAAALADLEEQSRGRSSAETGEQESFIGPGQRPAVRPPSEEQGSGS